jgi:hypothetical protein
MSAFLTVLTWMGLIILGLVALVFLLAALEMAVQQVTAWGRRSRTASLEGPRRPGLRGLALLVDVDEAAGLLRPSVQISGSSIVGRATVRVELVDKRGTVRLIIGRDFPPGATGKELALPPVPPPPGAGLGEVLRWRWDVVLQNAHGELGRWEERPARVGGVNAEAEIGMPVEAL